MRIGIIHGHSFGRRGGIESMIGGDQRYGAEAVRLVAAVDFERRSELHSVGGA
jgi:hypothetical protein